MSAAANPGEKAYRPGSGASPERTYALVVGIERYDAGLTWNLDGPAKDAARFISWLSDRGVPADQMLVFLSPLDEQPPLPPGITASPARRGSVTDAITRTLPSLRGDLLWLFWAGHGVLARDDHDEGLRLFYADASTNDKRNLDLPSLLTALRTDLFPGFPRQVGVVDACQTYVERLQSATTLPPGGFSYGHQLAGREQFVLYAASPGEAAANLGSVKAGLFSQIVMEELTGPHGTGWPPEMELVATSLDRRFSELREAGRADQTPTSFRWRPWTGGEQVLGGTLPDPTETANGVGRLLGNAALAELVDRLLDLDIMTDPDSRKSIIRLLRKGIATSIPHNQSSRPHVVNIITQSLHYPGGLAELMQAVKLYADPTDPALVEVEAAACRLGEEAERDVPNNVIPLPVRPVGPDPASLLTDLASRIRRLPSRTSESRLAVLAKDLKKRVKGLEEALESVERATIIKIELSGIRALLESCEDSSSPSITLRELRKAGERLQSYGHRRWPGRVG